jgi:hypothetical protein
MRELLKFFLKSASSLEQFIFVGLNVRTYKQRFDEILNELIDIAYAVFLTRVRWIWTASDPHSRSCSCKPRGDVGSIIFMHKWGFWQAATSQRLWLSHAKKG